MKSTRSTSFKSKFKNTSETTLNLKDGDDDLVVEPEEQVHGQKEHVKRERREIRSKRKYDRVPIVRELKNTGIDEFVKEEQEDHVRKTNKEYPPGLRYLPTRMKCDNITATVMGMSPEQK
ncbi:unnamed protein product [Lactuca saligna]|uniref:Uncharacterized protein n=1 Tax=Lactuca saligna TaxID=75948 RepID=A0AA35Y702_LACSI|nr:unnamed protein product [Lactuca saligna]